ncbi:MULTISPECIES: helix-turn-helix domain-containing protein [Butyricimonas]|jgi:transcriptional regulator with XRE-family HTH domain|uniref:helix-turn-helix domain-containing protein n=1 Tax=Butyricimonas TaxID=574697 RepID=UPI00095D49D1|nr:MULTISPECIES: helix-turn-helix domain-containing protein [Butyricimonas]MBS7199238.1 helix-turn-helix domain-containing protein [Bacteroidales bacterium]OKZ21372.1 MAG: hypothetical protein BHV81_00330 [Butyricimonas synergistica]
MLTKIEQYVIDRVRDRRNQLGLTQDDLAIKSGYSSGFIATVEAGKKEKKYNLNNLLAFAKAMKCSPRVFLPEDISNF